MRACHIEAAVLEFLPLILTLIIGIGAGVAIERLRFCRPRDTGTSHHGSHAPDELDARLSERMREIESLRSRIVTLEREEKELVLTDPLTGAANRTLLTDRIEHAITRGLRHNTRIGLLMICLRDFSGLSERFGTPSAERLLEMLTKRLSKAVRAEDTVAYLQGEVFAIALEGVFERDDLDRARKAVEQAFSEPFVLDDTSITLEADLSSALYPADGRDAEALLRTVEHGISAVRARNNSSHGHDGAVT